MRNTKRVISLILAIIILVSGTLGFGKIDSYAEDVSITLAIWPAEVNISDVVTATVTIKGDNVGEYDIFLEYPGSILSYNGDTSGSIEVTGSGAGSFSYTFKAIADGSGKIQTSGYKIYDVNGTQLSVVHAGGNVAVGQIQETEETIKIGNEVYTLVGDRNLPKAPEGYELSSVTYNDEEIYAYQSPNQKIKVVCLQNPDYEQIWFVYDEETGEFSPYVEYSLDGVRFVIINKPDDVKIPDNYEETALTLNKSQITAYTDGSDSGMYLVYALNQTGIEGLYYFDSNEGNLTRYDAVKAIVDAATASNAAEIKEEATTETHYATPLIADKEEPKSTEEEDGLLSRNALKKLLIMMIVLFTIMCIVVIILMIRNSMLQTQLYGDDEDDDFYDDDIVDKPKKEKKKKDSKKGFFDSLDEEEKDTKNQDSKDSDSKDTEDTNVKTGKSNSYAINEDTGEILLEEAMDNNAGVNVPPAEDVEDDSIEKAMQSRPFGVDSAFDVVAPEDAPEGENVYVEPEPTEEKNVFTDGSGFVDVDEIERQASKDENKDLVENTDSAENVNSTETSESAENIESVENTSSTEEIKEDDDSNQKEKSRKKNRKKNKKNKKKVEPQKVALPSQDDEEDE